MIQQTQYLVVTAIGTDRTGIVGDLTRLVKQCSCNIRDSRLAILGQEFTFIMLLCGDRQAIAKVENSLPSTSHDLGLLTMMKRTSKPKLKNGATPLVFEYTGADIPGTLSSVTEFLGQNNVNIASLKTDACYDDENQSLHTTYLTVVLPDGCEIDELIERLQQLCNKLGQDLSIKSTERLIG